MLAASPWGDPGGETRRDVQLGMRLSWAARLAGSARPPRGRRARPRCWWPERFAAARELPVALQEAGTLAAGRRCPGRHLPGRAGRRLPGHARWVLAAVEDPADLWLAEAGWWSRVERDGFELLGASGLGAAPVLGAVAVLAADAHRVGAAWNGRPRRPAPGGVRCPGVNGSCRCGCSGWRWSRPGTPYGRCWSASPTPARSSWTLGPRPRRQSPPGGGTVRPAAALARSTRRGGAALLPSPPDRAGWERAGRWDLLAGEAELAERARAAIVRGRVAALAGWATADAVPGLAARLAEVGGAVVPLPRPRGADPPTLLGAAGLRRSLTPLLETYGTPPYADVDPTVLAAVAYVLMFGMMFGDVGHGVPPAAGRGGAAGGAAAPAGPLPARLAVRHAAPAWPARSSGCCMGSASGPGIVPVLWLEPLEGPVTLLLAAVAVGAVLLMAPTPLGPSTAGRRGGWPLALYTLLRRGRRGGVLRGSAWPPAVGRWAGRGRWPFGAATAAVELALAFAGFAARPAEGGAGAARPRSSCSTCWCALGSNVVSFARLAAFGLTHAALGAVVWESATGLWGGGLTAS